jgi:hypothetical protein
VGQTIFAFAAFSVPISSGGVFLYSGGKNLLLLASITPASLGIVETMAVYLGDVLDYSTAEALMIQGITRVVAVTVLVLAGPFGFSALRWRRIQQSAKQLEDGTH